MNENGSRWHQATPQSLCQHLYTNAACGLSRKAARSRLKKQGRNPLFDDTMQKKKSPIKSLLFDPATLLMLFSALLAVVFLSPLQVVCTVVVLLLLVAALLRIFYKSEELLRVVAQYRTPTVRVLRDGRILTVSAARVVVGDILLLHTGDIVPGDCRLLSAQQLRVLTLQPNEKGNPIYKEYAKNADVTYPYGTHVDAPLAENMLYGGSEILCGEARAVLVATGERSYLGAMHSFTLPAEIKEKNGETPTQRILRPYLRLWSFFSLILLGVLMVIGLISKPTGGDLTEYFFILCILIAAASPAVLSLYLHWITVRGRLLCIENDPPKNRAVIKTEAGVAKLAGVTDLFVVGKRGLCDGITHFWSAFVKERELRKSSDEDKTDLQPLCEAMLLRHEAEMHSLTAGSFSSNEAKAAFLTELSDLCGFDVGALKVRLQKIQRDTYPNHSSWQCITAHLQEGVTRYLFDNSGTLMRHCMLYADGARMRAITPEYRSTLRKYCEYAEENGCRTLCVAKESRDGTLVLVGILALREQVSAVLPSVIEELSQSGITTRFFLSDDDYARVCRLPEPYLYCNAAHPNLTPALLQSYRTFIGFSKEELSVLLPTYQKGAHRIAVLGGKADDNCFLRAGVLTLACDTVADLKHYAENHIEEAMEDDGGEGSHNASQVLRRHADVIIERADRSSGGVYAALQAISHSRAVQARTQIFLQFWVLSQISRILMILLCVCSGIGLFSVLQMFLSSLAVEGVALCFIAEAPISQSALRQSGTLDQKFILQTLLSKKSLLPAVISAGVTALLTIVLTLTGVLTKSAAQTYLFLALFLLQIGIFCRICYKAGVKSQSKRVAILGGILLAAVALLTLLSSLISAFGAATGMGAWMALTAILLPLAPAVYFLLTLLLSFLHRTAK